MQMVYVYRSDTKDVMAKYILRDLLTELPRSLHDRAHRYKSERDAYNYVMGRLLLKKGLKDLRIIAKLEDISYTKTEKPILKGVFFNISHTENKVVCAFSLESEIGIDVEKKKEVDLKNFSSWFSEREWNDIQTTDDPLSKFYWYWTRKECIIKTIGENLSYLHKLEIDPGSNQFTDGGKKYYLMDLDLGPDYAAAICSELPIDAIELR